MIQLAGLVPEEDIEIRFTGVRPGEKLFEEISMHGENMLPTHHEKIRIFAGPGLSRKSSELDRSAFVSGNPSGYTGNPELISPRSCRSTIPMDPP